jgi:hypothetical protein
VSEPELIELVCRAIGLHETTLCLEFVNEGLIRRIRNDPTLQTVGTPREIRAILVHHVLAGGRIDCRRETREEYQGRREFWFRVRVPVPGFPRPLFYELELTDEDPDCPSAVILNVHF